MENLLTVGESTCTGHTEVNFVNLSPAFLVGAVLMTSEPSHWIQDPIHSFNNRWAIGVAPSSSAETTQAPSGPRPPRVTEQTLELSHQVLRPGKCTVGAALTPLPSAELGRGSATPLRPPLSPTTCHSHRPGLPAAPGATAPGGRAAGSWPSTSLP